MRVIIACECSGRVREAFRRLGHDAWSCDLLPAEDNSPYHYQCDIRDVLGLDWDLMIAHPDCTFLCCSGLHWNTRGVMVDGRPRQELTEEALDFVRLLMAAPIPRIAIENPIGCISSRIRKPDQIIQPYEYGENASKKPACGSKGCRLCNPPSASLAAWFCTTASWSSAGITRPIAARTSCRPAPTAGKSAHGRIRAGPMPWAPSGERSIHELLGM